MDGYKPSFTITNSILSHVASVSEKVGRITVMSNDEWIIWQDGKAAVYSYFG